MVRKHTQTFVALCATGNAAALHGCFAPFCPPRVIPPSIRIFPHTFSHSESSLTSFSHPRSSPSCSCSGVVVSRYLQLGSRCLDKPRPRVTVARTFQDISLCCVTQARSSRTRLVLFVDREALRFKKKTKLKGRDPAIFLPPPIPGLLSKINWKFWRSTNSDVPLGLSLGDPPPFLPGHSVAYSRNPFNTLIS